MKKSHLVLKASVVAVASALSFAAAAAGTVTVAASKFATEALASDTDVTLANVDYETTFKLVVGVPYRVSFDFDGSLGADGAVTGVSAGNDVICVPLIEADTTLVSYECSVDAVDATAKFTLAGAKVEGSALLNGGTLKVKGMVQSREASATYDQSAEVTAATGVQAVNLSAPSDTLTKTDATNGNGPLFGFVAEGTAPADIAGKAQSQFLVGNNYEFATPGPIGALCPNGVDTFTMFTACGEYNPASALDLTITDADQSFAGLNTDGLTVSCAGTGTQLFTLDASGDTATKADQTPTSVGFKAAGNSTTCTVGYEAAGNASLGTVRSLDLQVALDGGGQADSFSDSDWWDWGSNGAILYAPYAYGGSGWNTRVQLTNLDTSNDVAYSFKFYGEAGNACVLNTAANSATGTIPAGETVTIPLTGNTTNTATYTTGFSAICSSITDTAGTKQAGTVEVTIASPITKVKGAMISGFPGQIPQNVSMEPAFANN